MESMTVDLEIPDEVEERLRARWGDLPRRALEAVAIEAYRSGALTPAEVQQMLGLASRWDVEAFLRRADAFLDYGSDDIRRDLQELRRVSAP
jgi:predicted HTH domain antitoxin